MHSLHLERQWKKQRLAAPSAVHWAALRASQLGGDVSTLRQQPGCRMWKILRVTKSSTSGGKLSALFADCCCVQRLSKGGFGGPHPVQDLVSQPLRVAAVETLSHFVRLNPSEWTSGLVLHSSKALVDQPCRPAPLRRGLLPVWRPGVGRQGRGSGQEAAFWGRDGLWGGRGALG